MNISASLPPPNISKIAWILSNQVKAYKFEELDRFYWFSFVSDYRSVVFYVGALYIFTIFGLQRWMKDKPAYKLKMPLFWWNLGLGIFSIIGFVRLTPGMLLTLSGPNGLYNSLCTKIEDIPTYFWGLMFVFSKYVELGDTIFIVLRKRPLIFLQWYHHVSTLSMIWILAPYEEPAGRWLAWLNYGVHSFMYNYFALRAIGIKIPNFIANFITTLQFLQMIIGLGVNVSSAYYYRTGHNCFRHPESIQLFSLVCASFILLFGNLFYQSVIKKGRARKEKVKKQD